MTNRIPLLRHTLAGFLLVLFALSITPKRTLHDILTHHTDQQRGTAPAATEVQKAGFNCDVDNLVAESPFTTQEQIFDFSTVQVYAVQHVVYLQPYYSSAHYYFPLRGPPVISSPKVLLLSAV